MNSAAGSNQSNDLDSRSYPDYSPWEETENEIDDARSKEYDS